MKSTACARLVLAMLGASVGACSLVSLDNLDATGGVGGADASSSAATTASAPASASSGGGATSSTSSTAGGGGGGAGGGGVAGGGAGGGTCPDGCEGTTADLCDSFDASAAFSSEWEVVERNTERPSGSAIVDEPFASCPHAARIDYAWNRVENGGWYELSRVVPGQPTDVSFDLRVWRDTERLDMQGFMELGWEREGFSCFLQVQLSQPYEDDGEQVAGAIQAFLVQQASDFSNVGLGSDYFSVGQTQTARSWVDVGLDVHFGADAHMTLRFNGVDNGEASLFDDVGGGACPAGPPDDGTLRAYIGVPFDTEPFAAYYDDYRVLVD